MDEKTNIRVEIFNEWDKVPIRKTHYKSNDLKDVDYDESILEELFTVEHNGVEIAYMSSYDTFNGDQGYQILGKVEAKDTYNDAEEGKRGAAIILADHPVDSDLIAIVKHDIIERLYKENQATLSRKDIVKNNNLEIYHTHPWRNNFFGHLKTSQLSEGRDYQGLMSVIKKYSTSTSKIEQISLELQVDQ